MVRVVSSVMIAARLLRDLAFVSPPSQSGSGEALSLYLQLRH
jgi:hypothetical protein